MILIDDEEVWIGGGEGEAVSARVFEVFIRGEVASVSLEVEHKITGAKRRGVRFWRESINEAF